MQSRGGANCGKAWMEKGAQWRKKGLLVKEGGAAKAENG